PNPSPHLPGSATEAAAHPAFRIPKAPRTTPPPAPPRPFAPLHSSPSSLLEHHRNRCQVQGTSQRDFATNPPTIRNAHDSRPLDCHPEGAATKDPRLLFVSSIRTEPEKRLTSGLTTIQQLPTQTDGVA